MRKDLAFRDVKLSFDKDDTRPVIVLDDVGGAEFKNVKAQRAGGAPFFVLRKVADFSVGDSSGFRIASWRPPSKNRFNRRPRGGPNQGLASKARSAKSVWICTRPPGKVVSTSGQPESARWTTLLSVVISSRR